MQAQCRKEAEQNRHNARQNFQEACAQNYEKTALKANREKVRAEINRIDRDEKKHLLRTDAYFAHREIGREKLRQSMVSELDKQMIYNNQQRDASRAQKEAEKAEVNANMKRVLEADMAQHHKKKADELQLQEELKTMIAAKENREKLDGHARPVTLNTMSQSSIKNDKYNLMSTVDAARFISKPLGRPEGLQGERQVVPLDAPPGVYAG